MKINSKQQGFTTVELLIVFSIIAVMSTIGIASYVSFSKTQTLNAAVSEIRGMLGQAKSRTASQVKPSNVSCDNSKPLEGYVVNLCGFGASATACTSSCTNPSGNYACYELSAMCGNNVVKISTGKLPSGYSFTASPNTFVSNSKFFFPVLKGGTVIDNDGSINNGNIYIYNYAEGATVIQRQIKIDRNGNIN